MGSVVVYGRDGRRAGAPVTVERCAYVVVLGFAGIPSPYDSAEYFGLDQLGKLKLVMTGRGPSFAGGRQRIVQ